MRARCSLHTHAHTFYFTAQTLKRLVPKQPPFNTSAMLGIGFAFAQPRRLRMRRLRMREEVGRRYVEVRDGQAVGYVVVERSTMRMGHVTPQALAASVAPNLFHPEPISASFSTARAAEVHGAVAALLALAVLFLAWRLFGPGAQSIAPTSP